MKINSILLLLGIISLQVCKAQWNDQDRALLREAWAMYESKDYAKSGRIYDEALVSLAEKKKLTENEVYAKYNAACAWSLAREKDASFKHLFDIAKKGEFTKHQQLTNDTDLKSLQEDSRWEEIIKIVKQNEVDLKPLSKDELKSLFSKFQNSHKKVFKAGSSVADVDNLYSYYTDDFQYNHPGYGGIYSRELLYNNTVKSLKNGRYNDHPIKETLNIVIGKNAVIEEWKYEGREKIKVTLYKFKKDKIHYVEEFW